MPQTECPLYTLKGRLQRRGPPVVFLQVRQQGQMAPCCLHRSFPFFHQSKQYLGLGKCQSNDLDAHFTDVTVSMIQYILLTLRKRFEDYETKGALFKDSQEQMLELTLMHRLWGLFVEIVTQLTELFGVDTEQLMKEIFHNGKVNSIVQKLLDNIPERKKGTAA